MSKNKFIGIIGYLVLAAVVFAIPSIIPGPYVVHVLIITAMNIILASSLRLIHLSGQMSLAHSGMMTIGVEGFDLWDRLYHLLPPAAVLATLHVAGWSRYVRSSMLEVIGQDYIRTARSKGLTERGVIYGHALKNALLPLVTLVGLQGGRLIGGAMITEVVFAWPGMGRLLAESLSGRDYPVLMASFMLMSVLVIFGNLMSDLSYGIVDPRISLE